ncbi:MAG: hypothetical protein J6Z49_01270 [Kiritimatiellae bacterium]|nr:hypothetical protein [Kiritimatiellia bacterium]
MPLEFATYLSSARQLVASRPADAPEEVAIVLNGHKVIAVPAKERGADEIVRTKHDFIEAFVRQFGEGMRTEVAKLLNPEDAKPLTARTILAANEIASEATKGEMSKRLDALLLKASERTLTTVSKEELQKIASLYENDPKTKAFFDSLEATRQATEEAMAKLSSFSGKEIATAMRSRGSALPGDPQHARNEEILSTLKAAIDGFASLGETLRKLYNAGDGELTELFEIGMRCHARATEIERLALELSGLAQDAPDAPRLQTLARTLLPQTAIQMHGTEAALDALQQQLRPVAIRLDAIKESARKGGTTNWLEIKVLRDELALARDALRDAAKNGITYPGVEGVFRPDPGILNAFSKLLDQIEQDIRSVTEDLARISGQKYLDETCPKLSDLTLFSKFRDLLGLLGSKQAVENMEQLFDTIRRVALAWLETMIDTAIFASLNNALNAKILSETAQRNSLRILLQNLRVLEKALSGKHLTADEKRLLPHEAVTAINGLSGATREELRTALKQAFDCGALQALASADRAVPLLAKRLSLIAQTTQQKAAPSLANDVLLLKAFNGELDFATVAGARGWGATEEMIDLDICDANLVSKEALGSGQVNQTFFCTYKMPDGTTKQYVFKPELESEIGLHNMAGGTEGYDTMQAVVHLNAASCKAAELLGAKGILVASKVGAVKGKFGLFMEVAKGISLADVNNVLNQIQMVPSTAKKLIPKLGRLSPTYVNNLPKEKYRILAGNYLREGLNLEWSDWLGGQSDRHWGNYMIYVGDDLSVQIKGIDNDLSFPEWRTGMTKFHLEGKHLSKFLSVLGVSDAGDAAQLPGVSLGSDGQSLDIDLSQNWGLSEHIRQTVGVQVITLPSAISEEMYAKLMALDADRTKLRNEFDPHISEKALRATELRLDEMVAHAKKLKEKGMVIKADEWFIPQKQKQIVRAQKPKLTDPSGNQIQRQFYHSGIFIRDFNSIFGRGIV